MRKTGTAVFLILLLCCTFAAADQTMSRDEYRDRVAGGVLGQVAGTLTGFEFVWDYDGTPFSPLPDDWFALLHGPYGGGNAKGGAGVSRILENGIGGDDDYHIDFFSQHILQSCGPMPSHQEIMQEWRDHSVSDWGGGSGAMKLIRQSRLTSPYTGQQEYGNMFHWCTEAYIENETLGLVVPGMPDQAYRLSSRFASLTGDYDSLDWGRFWSCAYALAFVCDDIPTLLNEASGALLEHSHPWDVFQTCMALYAEKTPWKDAIHTIEGMMAYIPDSDNIQCAPDVNNGYAILALLYGEGDWLTSVQYAALSGYDGDCTAATVGGLVGTMTGLSGLPDAVRDLLWRDGNAVYVNDVSFTPHIQKDYPETQTFGSIVDLYADNGIAQLASAGAELTGDSLVLHETAIHRQGFQIDDFEQDDLQWDCEGDASFARSDRPHTGRYSLSIRLEPDAACAEASRTLSGLVPGKTYRASAYIQTSFDGVGVVSVEGADPVCAYNTHSCWALRECYFTATAPEQVLKLQAQQIEGDGGITVWFDDVRLECMDASFRNDRQILGVTLERRDQTEIPVFAAQAGDYSLIFTYRSVNRTGQSTAKVTINDETVQGIGFPGTTQVPSGGTSTLAVPVRLKEGENKVALSLNQNSVELLEWQLEQWPEECLRD